MAVLRYAQQEAANIAKAEARALQQSRLNAALARKKAAEETEAVLGSDYQPLDDDLTAIAELSPADDDFIQRKAGAWTNRTVAQVKTDLGVDGKLQWVTAPATATDPGTAGQVAYDGSFIYVCTATNTWVRAALSTW